MNPKKLFPVTLSVLGIGYILVNLAVLILLSHFLLQFRISSMQVVTQMGGVLLFIIASIMLMMVGFLLIFGGIQHFRGKSTQKVMLMGVLYASFYVLCLGMGSALMVSQTSPSVILLIVSPVLMMVGVATYTAPSSNFKIVGSVIGIVGALQLAVGIFVLQPLSLVFVGWDIPFPGPFMSMAILEGVAVVLGSVAVFARSLLPKRREEAVSHVLLSMVGLIYGINLFIGPLVFSFSLWNLIWKAPWEPPLNGAPQFILGTTILWSVSLLILAIGGILLTLYSFVEFALVTRKISGLQF